MASNNVGGLIDTEEDQAKVSQHSWYQGRDSNPVGSNALNCSKANNPVTNLLFINSSNHPVSLNYK
jgi:hypothetical protein